MASNQQSTIRNQRLAVIAPALLVAIAVVYKFGLLAINAVPFNGDEGIIALMARHILQGERPTFFYGQGYLGATDAWLVAISFSIFGQSVLAIRIVQIALFASFLITSYFVAKRFGLSEWGARIALMWLALPPTLLTLYTTATLGGYGETLVLGNMAILLSDGVARDAYCVKRKWLALGVVAGFGLYTFPLILIYLVPIGLWLFVQRRRRAWRGYLVALIGFAIGSAPWWLALIQSGGLPLAELAGAGVANTIPGSTYFETLPVRLINFFLFGLSAWWGVRYPWSSDLILPGVSLLALVTASAGFTFVFMRGLQKTTGLRGVRLFEFVVLTLAFSILMLYAPAIPGIVTIMTPVLGVGVMISCGAALVYAIKHGPRMLWGMIGMLLVTFLVTPFGGDPSGRYFLPLYLPLSLFIATLLQAIRNGKRTFVTLLMVALIGYNVAGTVLAVAKNPPGITTQFDPVTWIDHTHDQELIDFLLAHGETRGYTNYWVQTPIAFLSNERIISAAKLPYHLDLGYTPRDDRYPPYTRAVAEADRAFYITTNHPRLNQMLRSGLNRLGAIFEEHEIGNYHIFYSLSRKITPEELGVYDRMTR